MERTNDLRDEESTAREGVKKEYESPRVVELGTIPALTQSGVFHGHGHDHGHRGIAGGS